MLLLSNESKHAGLISQLTTQLLKSRNKEIGSGSKVQQIQIRVPIVLVSTMMGRVMPIASTSLVPDLKVTFQRDISDGPTRPGRGRRSKT